MAFLEGVEEIAIADHGFVSGVLAEINRIGNFDGH